MKTSELEMPRVMECAPAAKPLRIAVVYSRSPLPMRRADQMTVANLLSFLSARGHEVDLYALDGGGDVKPEHRDWLNRHCRKVQLFSHSKIQMMAGMIAGIVCGLPLQVGIFKNSEQTRAIRRAVDSGEYDIVYVYYLRSAETVRRRGRDVPGSSGEGKRKQPATFLALQLSQSLNTRRIYENAPNIWNRLLYFVESRLIARYETRIWRDYTHSVLIGPKDVEAINSVADRMKRPHISNYVFGAHGTDISRFKPRKEEAVIPNRLVFSGVMRTPTNVQAVQWFANYVWPLVRHAVPDATFEIVGREPTSDVKALAKIPGVLVAGTVPDPALNIARAAICVNPMQAGGGMQNKLIEYLASEKPVVATSVANEGIMAPADAIAIADTPETFANTIIGLLRDPKLAAEMATRARAYVVENWTWESHFLRLERNFENALTRP